MPTNNNNNSKTFYTIIGGKITQKVSEGTSGAVSRTNKLGAIVWESKWDKIEGTITQLSFSDHKEYGKSLVIDVDEGGVVCQLQLSTNSKYFSTFCKRIKGANIGKEMILAPYSFPDKTKMDKTGKPKIITGLSIYQDGKKVEAVITRDNKMPNEPQFPDDTSDKVAMAQYNVDIEKASVSYITSVVVTAKPTPPKSNIEFADFDDESTEANIKKSFGENEVPF